MKVEPRASLEYAVTAVSLCETGSHFSVYLPSLGNHVPVDCSWMTFTIETRVEIFSIENFRSCANLFDTLLSFTS